MNNQLKIMLAFVAGGFLTQLPTAWASLSDGVSKDGVFAVSIDEVAKTHVNLDEFSGTYRTVVTTLDGKTRAIELTPVLHNGRQSMRVVDNKHISYMALDGYVKNGTLRIQTTDKAAFMQRLKAGGW